MPKVVPVVVEAFRLEGYDNKDINPKIIIPCSVVEAFRLEGYDNKKILSG